MNVSSFHSVHSTLLLAVHLAALLGGFLAPNSPVQQDRDYPWAPPANLNFFDAEGRFHIVPFVYRLTPRSSEPSTYEEDTGHRYHLKLLQRGDAYRLLGLIPTTRHFIGVEPPARLYYLGTDGVGRDLFARTLVGGRVSLFAGLFAASLALALGLLLGGLAGYLGGRIDSYLMGAVELFLALPWLYLLLAVRAFLPLDLQPASSFFILVALIGFIGWAQPARLFRGVVLTGRESLFVAAARGYGAQHSRLIARHLFPQTLQLLRTQAAILVPGYILAEVALSFLGLGVAQPLISWGTLLAQLQRYHILANHPHLALPAIPLVLVAFSYFAVASAQPKAHLPSPST